MGYESVKQYFEENKTGFERLLKFKQWKLLKPFLRKDKEGNGGAGKPKSLLHYFFHI